MDESNKLFFVFQNKKSPPKGGLFNHQNKFRLVSSEDEIHEAELR